MSQVQIKQLASWDDLWAWMTSHGNAVPNYHTFVEVSGCGVDKSNGLKPTGKTVAILKIYSLGTCRLRPSAENHIDASRFASNFSCASPSTFVLGFSIGAANIHGFHELRYNLGWIISKRAIHGALVSQPWVYTNKKTHWLNWFYLFTECQWLPSQSTRW